MERGTQVKATAAWIPSADAVEIVFDRHEFGLPEQAQNRFVMTPQTAVELSIQLTAAWNIRAEKMRRAV